TERERERLRERLRQRQRQRDRKTETERDKERQRDRKVGRDRERGNTLMSCIHPPPLSSTIPSLFCIFLDQKILFDLSESQHPPQHLRCLTVSLKQFSYSLSYDFPVIKTRNK